MNRKQFILTSVAILLAIVASAAFRGILHVPPTHAQALPTGLFPAVQADDKEPIATIGHGGFFDQSGKQIALTLEFVAQAQAWYRAKLLSTLTDSKRAEFAQYEKRLNADVSNLLVVKQSRQSQLVVQQYLLDWLVANSDISKDGRTVGKLNALKYALHWRIPSREKLKDFQYGEEFKLDPELEKKLRSPKFNHAAVRSPTATVNQGQAYLTQCSDDGVPIPPRIGLLDPAGLNGWKSQGFIPINDQFIGQNNGPSPAEVRTYQSSSPAGMCFALPRYTNNAKTTVGLDGVICLGQQSSKVCFWDNQMNGQGFPFATGTQIPIGVPDLTINPAGQYQAGGFELNNGSGGVCTDCHAGQNPYIIHPNVNLGSGVFMGSLNPPPHSLTFGVSRYDPFVPASWPQNQLSMSPPYVPAVCSGCHVAGGSAGAFPHLSTEIQSGYCNTVLAQAITKTMPPGNPGGEASNPTVIAFQNWCGVPTSSGPSDRGDPHLTTTNGINYDFQAAGEFTALRNSATGFELQTRQTPVSVTFTPGVNAHTGLASCVSLNTAVAVRIGKHSLTYEPSGKFTNREQLQLRLDDVPTTVPTSGLNLGNGNLITRADSSGGLDIKLSDGTHLIITPNFWTDQGYWYLNVEVLNTPAREGTMGYIPAGNWLPLAPNGSSFGAMPASLANRHILLNQIFANAWRVTNTTSLFDYAAGTSTADFTDLNWPPKPGEPCKASSGPVVRGEPVKPDVARRLCSQLKDKAAYENCVFDVITTRDPGVAKAYLRSLQLRQNAIIGVP